MKSNEPLQGVFPKLSNVSEMFCAMLTWIISFELHASALKLLNDHFEIHVASCQTFCSRLIYQTMVISQRRTTM